MIRTSVALLFLVSVFIGCQNKDPYNGDEVDVSFEEVLVFGSPDTLSKESLLGALHVKVDNTGKIL